MSGLATVSLALLFPADYDWVGTRAIKTMADEEPPTPVGTKLADEEDASAPTAVIGEDEKQRHMDKDGTRVQINIDAAPELDGEGVVVADDNDQYLDRAELQRVFVRASIISGTLALIITFVCPF